MVLLLDRRKWNEQPVNRSCRINAGSPLSIGVCHAFNYAAGSYDIAAEKVSDFFSLPTQTIDLYGVGYTTSSTNRQTLTPGLPSNTSDFSYRFVFRYVASATHQALFRNVSGTGPIAVYVKNPGAFLQVYVSSFVGGVSSALTPGELYDVVITRKNGGNLTLYLNGILQFSDTYTAGNTLSSVHFWGDQYSQAMGGNKYYLSVHDRVLTSDEIQSNPWEIFERDSRIVYFDLASGGIALTGSSQAAAYGQVIPDISAEPSGQQVSANQGSLSAVVDYLAQLTGLSTSAVAGAMAPALIAALSGDESAFQQGALASDISAMLSGNSATGAIGTLTASQALEQALSGLFSTASNGDLASAISAALSGNSATASGGTLTASQAILQALTGLSATASIGELAAALATSISGLGSILSGGTVTPLTGILAQLTGLESTLIGGAVSTAVTNLLSGGATTLSVGTPIAGRLVSVSGFEISSAANQVGVSAAIGATSASVILQNGTISVYNPDVTLGISGSQIALQYGLLSKEAQLALFGQDLAISGGQLVAIVEALGLGQSINIMQGSASLSVDKSLSGLVTLSGNGTVVFTDNNLQVALNGQSILSSAGRIFIKGGALGSSSITILQV